MENFWTLITKLELTHLLFFDHISLMTDYFTFNIKTLYHFLAFTFILYSRALITKGPEYKCLYFLYNNYLCVVPSSP